MRVAIVGSRDYPKLQDVRFYVAALAGRRGDGPLVLISGGAEGVDEQVAYVADQLGLDLVEHLPNWSAHPKAPRNAAHDRNQKIVDDADLVVAFWTGRSPGMRDTINRALACRKHLEVIFP